ncbi:MAG: RNA-binding protein [Deltaproteobacteria bacterium]|nr:RNA-binding protein [Deltaproteobacteria bacterium]MCL5276477.1 RNA-binding protein [Deltaproteobacteria bacterium]
MVKLYVGNLAFTATEEEVKGLFEKVGSVQSVSIIKDKYSDHSKGFGFVEMANDDDAKKAIEQINGTDFKGRNIRVAEAKPMEKREDRPRRGGSKSGDDKGGYNKY